MTILTLNKLWINRMDTGEGIAGASGRTPTTGYSIDGAVRTYASGRRRAVSVAGLKTEVTRSMVALDFATKEKLIGWLGANVQMRDARGNKWFGVFFDVAVSDYMRPDLYSVAVSLLTTTTVEGV
jgi:hypothetical protein